MCLEGGGKGRKTLSCLPFCQEHSVYKTAKVANEEKLCKQGWKQHSPLPPQQHLGCPVCLTGWDGHVHSELVSAELLLLGEMCRLIPAMDFPPPAINFFFSFNLYRLNSDQNWDRWANKPMTTVLMGYELVAFYFDLPAFVSYTNIIIWH